MASVELRVALFVDGGDWHARALARAFAARDATAIAGSLRQCAFDTRAPCGLDIPGFAGALPDAAFVRSIAAGSFEQITFRLGILHALRECGVAVWNDARAIERCVDKSATTFLLARAGLPTPATRTGEGRAGAERHVASCQARQVSKPLFGARGKGLRQVGAAAELPAAEEVGQVYYLQEFVEPAGPGYEDWRLFVSAGRVIAAMRRRSSRWITNLHQGGAASAARPDADLAALAVAAVAAVGADYAGVDLLRGRNGAPWVLEVNSMPSWRGLQGVSDGNIAQRLADDFLDALHARRRR